MVLTVLDVVVVALHVSLTLVYIGRLGSSMLCWSFFPARVLGRMPLACTKCALVPACSAVICCQQKCTEQSTTTCYGHYAQQKRDRTLYEIKKYSFAVFLIAVVIVFLLVVVLAVVVVATVVVVVLLLLLF